MSALPSIWNGVRALRASCEGVTGEGRERERERERVRQTEGGREEVAHSWEDEDRNAR